MKMLLYLPTETVVNDYATAVYVLLVALAVLWVLFGER